MQTIDILKGLKSRFEEHHNVKYATAALQAAAELSAKYINDRHLPDKAIDVMDEAASRVRLQATLPPPELRDAHYAGAKQLGHGRGYIYPHDDPPDGVGCKIVTDA